MNVTVTLRGELADGEVEELQQDLADGSTLGDLLASLAIPEDEVKLALVNALPVSRTTQLQDGDNVTLGG